MPNRLDMLEKLPDPWQAWIASGWARAAMTLERMHRVTYDPRGSQGDPMPQTTYEPSRHPSDWAIPDQRGYRVDKATVEEVWRVEIPWWGPGPDEMVFESEPFRAMTYIISAGTVLSRDTLENRLRRRLNRERTRFDEEASPNTTEREANMRRLEQRWFDALETRLERVQSSDHRWWFVTGTRPYRLTDHQRLYDPTATSRTSLLTVPFSPAYHHVDRCILSE